MGEQNKTICKYCYHWMGIAETWVQGEGIHFGVCRRYPPTRGISSRETARCLPESTHAGNLFPETPANQTCGEFKQKAEEETT